VTIARLSRLDPLLDTSSFEQLLLEPSRPATQERRS
jgi:hypothetical protein